MVIQHTLKKEKAGIMCCTQDFLVPDEYVVAEGAPSSSLLPACGCREHAAPARRLALVSDRSSCCHQLYVWYVYATVFTPLASTTHPHAHTRHTHARAPAPADNSDVRVWRSLPPGPAADDADVRATGQFVPKEKCGCFGLCRMVPSLAKSVPCYKDLSSFEFRSPNGEFIISRGDEKKREVVNVVDKAGNTIGQAVENGMTPKERNCKLMCSGEFTEYLEKGGKTKPECGYVS